MSKIKLTGSNSGYVEISSAADAGNLTLALPTSGTVLLSNTDNVFSGITTFTGLNITDDVTFNGGSYDVLWDASDNQLEFGDNAKLSFGGSQDLQIFHNGSVNLIQGAGSKNIYIQGDDVAILNQAGNQTSIWCNSGGSVDLHYANSQKFRTTNTGAIVPGICTASMLNIYGTNVKPVIGETRTHTVHYSGYDSQNNTTLEISSSGTGTNVAGLAINNPTTSANSSYKTLTFCCSCLLYTSPSPRDRG